jgi:hypothetical protein
MTSISAASLLPIARLTWRERLSARHEHPIRAHSHSSRAPRRRVGLLAGRIVALPERRVHRRTEARICNSAKGKRRTKLELWFEKDLMLRFRGRDRPYGRTTSGARRNSNSFAVRGAYGIAAQSSI